MTQIDIHGVNGSKEMLKAFIKELMAKIHPDYEQSFTITSYVAEDKQAAIYQLTKAKVFIRFEPIYPLKIVFSDNAIRDYNKVFLLLLHVHIARWNLVSRL